MLEVLRSLPVDPILGLMLAYAKDQNPNKVDLGAGVYKDERGCTPIMSVIKKAQQIWFQEEDTKVYAPQAGFPGFNQNMLELLLGSDHIILKEHRAISVQTPGGCAALRIMAGLINRCRTHTKVWLSNPTWANHIPLLSSAGLQLVEYPYYDQQRNEINFDAMMDTLKQAQKSDLVLLHACCHNPSGADLNRDQWRILTEYLSANGVVPFLDTAYQGLGKGLQEDVWGLRHVVEHCPEVIITSSCSKNFGLYRERVGAAVIIAESAEIAQVSQGQLLNIAREIYSMPPSYGAALVNIVLSEETLTQEWQAELQHMRLRISTLREEFSKRLNQTVMGERFDYIKREKGMFSFLGLDRQQVGILCDRYSIYLVNSSRVNVAGLNDNNMDYVIDSLVKVITDQ